MAIADVDMFALKAVTLQPRHARLRLHVSALLVIRYCGKRLVFKLSETMCLAVKTTCLAF